MKLELKHIVGYLPYKLECKYKDWEKPFQIVGTSGKTLLLEGDWTRLLNYTQTHLVSLEFIKPILRPMNDIVKPCIDGKIPVEEISKIHIGYNEAIGDKDFKAEYSFSRQMRIDITWLNPISKERLYSDDLFIQTERTHLNRYWVNEWLYKHHFDIHGLIEQGLAIGVNTLQL